MLCDARGCNVLSCGRTVLVQDVFRSDIEKLSVSLCEALVNHLIRPVLVHSLIASAYPPNHKLPTSVPPIPAAGAAAAAAAAVAASTSGPPPSSGAGHAADAGPSAGAAVAVPPSGDGGAGLSPASAVPSLTSVTSSVSVSSTPAAPPLPPLPPRAPAPAKVTVSSVCVVIDPGLALFVLTQFYRVFSYPPLLAYMTSDLLERSLPLPSPFVSSMRQRMSRHSALPHSDGVGAAQDGTGRPSAASCIDDDIGSSVCSVNGDLDRVPVDMDPLGGVGVSAGVEAPSDSAVDAADGFSTDRDSDGSDNGSGEDAKDDRRDPPVGDAVVGVVADSGHDDAAAAAAAAAAVVGAAGVGSVADPVDAPSPAVGDSDAAVVLARGHEATGEAAPTPAQHPAQQSLSSSGASPISTEIAAHAPDASLRVDTDAGGGGGGSGGGGSDDVRVAVAPQSRPHAASIVASPSPHRRPDGSHRARAQSMDVTGMHRRRLGDSTASAWTERGTSLTLNLDGVSNKHAAKCASAAVLPTCRDVLLWLASVDERLSTCAMVSLSFAAVPLMLLQRRRWLRSPSYPPLSL